MSPVFNADQCFICHSQPAIGGSTPAHSPAEKIAHRLGGTNIVPAFEEPDGPFREVRFKFNEDGNRDGGVHSLFTLQGRSDTPGCTLEQPDFEKAVRERNIAFRIPLQLFGLGLIESIQDSAIRANMNANRELKGKLGITGHPNIVPNNGTISRFGWKAQNGSLTIFAGEAYNVEMGISNDEFPIGRSEDPDCNVVYEPFDIPRTEPDLYPFLANFEVDATEVHNSKRAIGRDGGSWHCCCYFRKRRCHARYRKYKDSVHRRFWSDRSRDG
jgi:Di-haem oxidoreductase, putative peroxidase